MSDTAAGGTPFDVLSFHSGGTGARPTKDGLSATAFPSGVRSVPAEIVESIAPVVIWRKEYRTDSGGPGRLRGGLGQVMEIGSAENAPFSVYAMFERIDHPARGRDGGHDGAAGRVSLVSGKTLRGKGQQTIPPGNGCGWSCPAAAGFGDPRERDPRRSGPTCATGWCRRRRRRRRTA